MKFSHKTIKLSSLRYLYLLVIPIFFVQISPRAFGLSATQQNLFNSGVYYFDSATSCSTTLVGKDNREKTFNYFVGKGLTGEQAVAIIGNLMQESSINPASVQSPGEGRGIAQWDQPMGQPEGTGGRWGNLNTFARNLSLNPLELSTQLDFMWYELTGHYQSGFSKFQSVTRSYSGSSAFADSVAIATAQELTTSAVTFSNKLTPNQLLSIAWATVVFDEEYEKAGTPNMTRRISLAYATLKDLGGSFTSTQQASGTNGCSNNCALSVNTNLAGLSTIRQKVVCIAQQERDKWIPPDSAISTKKYLTYTDNLDQEWCADFASWVYEKAGQPLQTDNQGRVAAVRGIYDIGNSNKGFYYYPATSYTPRPGDFAIKSSATDPFSHVYIVTGVTATSITVISGNIGNSNNSLSRVSEYTLNLDKAGIYNPDSIIGYVSPDAK